MQRYIWCNHHAITSRYKLKTTFNGGFQPLTLSEVLVATTMLRRQGCRQDVAAGRTKNHKGAVACRGWGERGDGPGHPMHGGHLKSEITKIKML